MRTHHRRPYDDYDTIASEIMTMVACGGQTMETMDEIADLLRSTFPPSDTAPSPDGGTLPVAVLPPAAPGGSLSRAGG